jgi:PPE-repeat protein
MNRNFLFILLLSIGLGSVATAAEPKQKGFYIGGSVGVSNLDDDGAFDGLDFDDSDTAIALFGGYKILKYLAVEGRLTSFGTFSLSDGFTTEKADLSSISAHVVGIVPFGTSGWELFGQLGLGNMDFDCDGCSDETVGSAGLGVRYYPTTNLSISFQIDAYAWEEDGFGTTYDFAASGSQVGVQYIF